MPGQVFIAWPIASFMTMVAWPIAQALTKRIARLLPYPQKS